MILLPWMWPSQTVHASESGSLPMCVSRTLGHLQQQLCKVADLHASGLLSCSIENVLYELRVWGQI